MKKNARRACKTFVSHSPGIWILRDRGMDRTFHDKSGGGYATWPGGSGSYDDPTQWSSGIVPANNDMNSSLWDVTVRSGTIGVAIGEVAPWTLRRWNSAEACLILRAIPPFITCDHLTWSGGTLSGAAPLTTDAVGGVSLDTTSNNITINGSNPDQ